MIDDVLLDTKDKMDKTVQFLQQEMTGLRTGKANPALVDNITVDYYGTPTRLRDIANISTPEPRLIVINPFDPSSLGLIEKAIVAANIGITPMNDGRLIRVPIPELSEERRKDMVKMAGRITEEQRISVRNIRRDSNEQIKALQKSGEDVQPVDTTQLNSGDRLAEIRQRIETGFYDTPEARRQIADRLIDDLDL